MITTHPVHREDDGELLGFLKPVGDHWQPLTVFGYPLAEPADHGDSTAVLERAGLSYLAERWSVYWPSDDAWYACQLLEVAPGRVTVSNADFGSPEFGTTVTLDGPDRLRLG